MSPGSNCESGHFLVSRIKWGKKNLQLTGKDCGGIMAGRDIGIRIFRKVFGFGIDILTAIMIMIFLRPGLTGAGLLLLYSVVRAFFVRNILTIAVVNGIIIYSIITNSIRHRIMQESEILFHAGITGVLLALAAVQVFVILFRVFSIEDCDPGETAHRQKNWRQRIVHTLESLHQMIGVVLATIYPVLLTIVIIVSFAGLYSTSNAYYMEQSNEKATGLVYSDTEELLRPVNMGGPMISGIDIKGLVQNDFVYFSTVTYFTVGYGDIVPKGTAIKNLIIMESLMAHILNISIFALFGTLFYEFVKNKNQKKRNRFT